MLISQLYRKHPKTIASSATVIEALNTLIKEDVNALLVVNNSEKLVGVLSLQDIAAATVPTQFKKNVRMAAAMFVPGFFTEMCQEIKENKVSTIMRKEFVKVALDDNIMAVTADFLKNDLYVVPVVDKGELVGVVTRTEIKDALVYGMRKLREE